jgi:hypothetical protein
MSTIWQASVLVLLRGQINEERRWDGLRRHDIHTKFNDYRSKKLSNIVVIISTIWEAAVLVLLMEGIYEVHHRDGVRWLDIRTKFHEHRLRHSRNVKVITSTIWACSIGIGYRWGGVIYEVRCWYGLRRYHMSIYSSFHEVQVRHSSNIKVYYLIN